MTVATFVRSLTQRLRWRDGAWIMSAALLAATLVGVAARAFATPVGGVSTALAIATAVVVGGVWRRRPSWRAPAVAALAEARVPGLDNLLVTAVASETMPSLSPVIRAEVQRQAEARLAAVRPASLVTMMPAAASLVATLVFATAAALWPPSAATVVAPREGAAAPVDRVWQVTATITPPAYLRADAQTLVDPGDVRVPAGGSLRLVVRTGLAAVTLEDATTGAVTLERGGASGTFERTWSPQASTTAALVGRDDRGATAISRLLTVAVARDEPPTVRVAQPGRDLRLPSADAPIALVVEAADDHGVAALELRYVRMAGSGETFTFNEGRVPLTNLVRAGAGLQARLSWSLSPLGLEAGESLVYRVVARDEAPGQPFGESESYTIDIGTAFETSGAGAAVAEEDRRYAISQQMVIVHTERALAEKGAATGQAWLERTQGIGAEQRMVRAEVVFLSGGEVEDEVEEAARGDELQEGRLENRGRAEMQRAMAEMSRAEARLTAGDARGALVFERQALAALLKAFDRRRYFLRTVPERARIDLSRRLSGDRTTAAPGTRTLVEREDPVARERALLLDLAAAGSSGSVAAVAARVAGLVPGNAAWSRLAAQLLQSSDATARRAAVAATAAALRDRVRNQLPPAPATTTGERDYLDGLWRREQRAGSPR